MKTVISKVYQRSCVILVRFLFGEMARQDFCSLTTDTGDLPW